MEPQERIEQADVGFEVIDAEHRIQTGLIDAMHDAIRQGREPGQVAEILEQLLDYSRVHFLSEQLLMRLHAYPGYEDHVGEHERMVTAMEDLQQAHRDGTGGYTPEAIESLRALLIGHICGKDADLGRHMATTGLGQAAG